jgi:iron complex outermembrane receptor protein
MAQRLTLQRLTAFAALCQVWSQVGVAQQRDTTARPADSLKVYTLPPAVVSVTRANPPINKVPQAVQLVEKAAISEARPTWGLDEALASVPGVYAANRYNFSLDQRISIRGFGARSQFAVRGVKVLVDGIPQTLPDGTGQLTNLELGEADRIEVLRGSSSALFGNATGGVISVWTDPAVPTTVRQDVRVLFGTFDRDLQHNWSKWQSSTAFRVGSGSGMVTVSRLDYTGERQHSSADFRTLNTRWHFPLAPGWSLAASADVGWDPRADNPGALTAAELARNRDSAAAINLTKVAGKDVTQGQAGVTVRRQFAAGGDASLSVFGLTRSLKNPQTFAYINLDRADYGARLLVNRPLPLGALEHRLTAGLDFQRQRDNRLNVGNNAGQPDTVRQLDQLEHVTEVGPFVQSALQLTPHVAFTAGLRYDWVTFEAQDRINTPTHPDGSGRRLMSALSGSLGVAVTPTDALTVYGNVGTSFETPTTTELTNRPDSAGGFNPNLNPQTATNYELGSRGVVAAGRLSYSIALFQAEVRDELIGYQVPPPAAIGRVFFRNAGRSRHRGVELGATADLVPGLRLSTAWTYSDFRYTNYTLTTGTPARAVVLDGRAIPGLPQHWLHIMLRARPGFAHGGWAELEETHSSGFVVNDTLATTTSPWWASNLRLGWAGTVGSVRLSPFLGVNNLFNRAYVSSVVINAAQGRYYEPAPGRNLYVGFSLGAGE